MNKKLIIAGPCSVESEDSIFGIASKVASTGATVLRGGAFKPRTDPSSFQGLGKIGVDYLVNAAKTYNLLSVTEVLDIRDLEYIAQRVDMLQIGARNMFNYALIKEAGTTGLPIILKRGFCATISEWILASKYITKSPVIFCERGIRSFDNATRNLLDLASVVLVKEETGGTVIVDPSHGSGRRNLVLPLAKAALAVGADGLMIEVHTDPDNAISDKDQTVDFETLKQIIDFANLDCFSK